MNKSSPAPLNSAIRALQRLSDVFARRRTQLAQAAGLSEAQWRVLEEIEAEGFMPSLFARQRDCSPAAVSNLLRQLADQKLVRASISSRDARQRDYALTPAGRRALERVREARRAAIDAVWADLDPGQLEQFAEFSSALAERLEALAEAAEGAGSGA